METLKQKFKFVISDIGIFFLYMFSFREMYFEIKDSINKIKKVYNSESILKSDRFWYYFVMALFIIIMLLYHGNKKYFYAGIILLVWLFVALVPMYKSGEHRDWNRKRLKIPNKYEIKRIKEKSKNLNMGVYLVNYG